MIYSKSLRKNIDRIQFRSYYYYFKAFMKNKQVTVYATTNNKFQAFTNG